MKLNRIKSVEPDKKWTSEPYPRSGLFLIEETSEVMYVNKGDKIAIYLDNEKAFEKNTQEHFLPEAQLKWIDEEKPVSSAVSEEGLIKIIAIMKGKQAIINDIEI